METVYILMLERFLEKESIFDEEILGIFKNEEDAEKTKNAYIEYGVNEYGYMLNGEWSGDDEDEWRIFIEEFDMFDSYENWISIRRK